MRQVAVLCFLVLAWKEAVAVINNRGSFVKPHGLDFTIHKVSFTQKGYIQFLRYVSEVPPLTDYTFCIWVRSNNLTYAHPILSYSKHEEQRLIRVWISPHGDGLNLEILEQQLFNLPIKFVENHWYHLCQSWSSHQAAWNVYLNGKLRSSGFEPKLRGAIIEGGGDIVVGQEYTDFDKGLDDGIEGDIFGFNFVLSPTSFSPKINFPIRRHFQEHNPPQHRPPSDVVGSSKINFPIQHRFQEAAPQRRLPSDVVGSSKINFPNQHQFQEAAPQRRPPSDEVPHVLGYFNTEPNRKPKGLSDLGTSFLNMFNFFEPPKVRYVNKQFGSRVFNDLDDFRKPLGLRLVELSYDCFLGKGSPVSGKEVLISWTRSPVRVFGGAILKTVPPFCV